MDDATNQPGGGATGGDAADVVAVGFATTVAMWAAGYICRALPALVPPWAVLTALTLGLLGGGLVLGRFGRPGRWRGAGVGLLAGVLNLLILGGFLGERGHREMLRWVALWLPASLLICMTLTLLGAWAGAATRPDRDRWITPIGGDPWTFVLAVVAAAAAFVLVVVGGLVTGFHAGLSVPDWPTSFHMTMFLYPLAWMTGGVYYEHAHRLYGTLVGLTTIALAAAVWRTDPRRWLRWVMLAAVLAVIGQGILGGWRVTAAAQPGAPLSTPHDETLRSLTLAVTHGVCGQVFLGLMTAVAVFCAPLWRQAPPYAGRRTGSGADRLLTAIALAAVVLQLVLGALQRQTRGVLLPHIVFAAITAALVLTANVRAWGLYSDMALLPRLGLIGMGLLLLQLLLGVAALVARIPYPPGAPAAAVISTLHQAGGAALLVSAVMLHLWTARLLRPRRVSPV